MSGQRLSLAFGGRTVAVESPDPAILQKLRQRFEALEAPGPECVMARFEARPEADGSYVFRHGEVTESCRSVGHLVERVGYEIALDIIEARPDLLWLHAASAAFEGSAVVLAGPSGRGKSTVVTGLCERGWSYMSDDISPLDPATGLVFPFALSPAVRRHPGVELPADRVRMLEKAEIRLRSEEICPGAVPVGALIFPHYEHGAGARLLPCSPADAARELLACCLNYIRHREAAVRYICALVQKVPIFRLSFGAGQDAAALLSAFDYLRCPPPPG